MRKIVALAAALFASSAYAVVTNTPHDISTGGIGVCQYCHMPHNSLNTAGVPLWAKNLPTNITAYTSSRITAGTVNLTQTNYSLLCLSCHDGQVALGTLHNGTVLATDGSALDANTNLGTTLANDHPVGLAYPTTGTTATSSGLVTLASATGAGYVFFGASNYMECGSCHDPHIWAASGANAKFKRTVSAGDFCAGCHGNK